MKTTHETHTHTTAAPSALATNTDATADVPDPNEEQLTAALALVAPELDALSAEQVMQVNVDIPHAVRVALTALPAIRTMRPQMLRDLPNVAIHRIDGLEEYAFALWYAHGLMMPEEDVSLQTLIDEAVPLRANLLAGADALVHYGYVSAEKVADIRRGRGFLDTADDLSALAGLYRVSWDKVADKTPVTHEEVDRAAALATKLMRALGIGGSAIESETADRRARAFTLFVNAYSEAQRAATYIRWYEGDAKSLVPSLYANPRRRKPASNGNAPDATPDATQPSATAPTVTHAAAAPAEPSKPS